MQTRAPFDVVVLAGGRARRLGNVDKAAVTVGGRTMLDRVLGGCAEAREIVVVGTERPKTRPVRWTLEPPPGSGPVAGIAAGIGALPLPTAPITVVLATDMPAMTTTAIHRLVDACDYDGVVFEDANGHQQPLCAAYDATALTTALRALVTLENASLRSLSSHLELRTVADELGVSRDVDTPADLGDARLAGGGLASDDISGETEANGHDQT